MRRPLVRVLIAAALVGTGWAAARAQSTEPTFELVVDAPAGETTIECVRGCRLAWVERGRNPAQRPVARFKFACSTTGRCSSHRVGGWVGE